MISAREHQVYGISEWLSSSAPNTKTLNLRTIWRYDCTKHGGNRSSYTLCGEIPSRKVQDELLSGEMVRKNFVDKKVVWRIPSKWRLTPNYGSTPKNIKSPNHLKVRLPGESRSSVTCYAEKFLSVRCNTILLSGEIVRKTFLDKRVVWWIPS